MGSKWSDPQTILALVNIGAGLAPTIIAAFQKSDDVRQKLQVPTVDELIAMGIERTQAEIMVQEAILAAQP